PVKLSPTVHVQLLLHLHHDHQIAPQSWPHLNHATPVVLATQPYGFGPPESAPTPMPDRNAQTAAVLGRTEHDQYLLLPLPHSATPALPPQGSDSLVHIPAAVPQPDPRPHCVAALTGHPQSTDHQYSGDMPYCPIGRLWPEARQSSAPDAWQNTATCPQHEKHP